MAKAALPKTPRASSFLIKSKKGRGWLSLGVTGWEWTQDKETALQLVKRDQAGAIGARFMAGNYEVVEYQL